MEKLDVSLHEQRLHLIFKQTMMYRRSDEEGNVNVNVLKPKWNFIVFYTTFKESFCRGII